MYRQIKNLLLLLSKEQRKKLLILQGLVIISAFAELASVLAIGPFMALVADINNLDRERIFVQFFQKIGIFNSEDILFYVGVLVLILLAIAAAISIYTISHLSLYASKIGAELSTRLYKYYMYKPWIFHAGCNSSSLSNNVAQEAGRITGQIIRPLMIMNAKFVMTLVLGSAIFTYNPFIATIGIVIFTIAYLCLYRVVRNKLIQNGKKLTHNNLLRFRLMNEGFSGIKDTLLLGRQTQFNDRFSRVSQNLGRAQGIINTLSMAPRYGMELVASGSVVFLILYLIKTYEGNLSTILPILSIYALAGLKLLPAFQQMYVSLTQIRAALPAFEQLKEDLIASSEETVYLSSKNYEIKEKLQLRHSVEFQNVSFSYPGKETAALNKINIVIPANKTVGFVGASGSGKSTAIDILLGLIEPLDGKLMVDGLLLEGATLRKWQNNVGFVPQSIFLSDTSIRENVAFGLAIEDIDEKKIVQAIKMANLEEFIQRLPEGLDTRVGERGVQLSGGQRQRIGIARALYNNVDILVLDEATSALDGITEKLVIDAINDFYGDKTIIMIAHRLSTVRNCDCIYLLDEGTVIDQGTYDELVDRNLLFKKMAISNEIN